MKIVNEVSLSGTVATDVKQSGNGPHRFRLKQRGSKRRDSEGYWPDAYFSVIAWPKQIDAETIAKLKLHTFIEVAGRLKPTQWEKDGVKQYGIDVLAVAISVPDPEPRPLTPNLDRDLHITDADIPF